MRTPKAFLLAYALGALSLVGCDGSAQFSRAATMNEPPTNTDAGTVVPDAGHPAVDSGVAEIDAGSGSFDGGGFDAQGPVDGASRGWFGIGQSELAPHAVRVMQVPATGGISRTSGLTNGTTAAIGNDGRPVVAWTDYTGGNGEIYVRRWSGTAWEELDGSATGGGVSNNDGSSVIPALAVDDDGHPIVAWQDNTSGTIQIYLKRWDGVAWIPLANSASGGGVSSSGESSYLASLAIGQGGHPVIAWEESSSPGGNIYLNQWDANARAWVELGSSASNGGISNSSGWSSRPSVSFRENGGLVVAWQETDQVSNTEIFVSRWTQGTWQSLAGVNTGLRVGQTHSNNPAVVIDSSGNPMVAWQAFDWYAVDTNEIHVRRWANAGWQTIPGSVTAGGFYLNGTNYWPIALALDRSDRPLVAWTDNTTGTDEVHFRRHNGADWEELASSATGSGVSNSDSASFGVGLVVDSMACITWTESDSNHSQAVLRCHDL